MWIRAAGACGAPETLAQEPSRLQRTSADGSVKHADEFWGRRRDAGNSFLGHSFISLKACCLLCDSLGQQLWAGWNKRVLPVPPSSLQGPAELTGTTPIQ